MTKKDLKTGMMVETRNEDKYIVINNKLACVIKGHMNLDDYDNELFVAMPLEDDYKNDDYDIIKVYDTDNYGNYKCVWDRSKIDAINKKEFIINMKDSENYEWSVWITPNNPAFGYNGSKTDTPFCIDTSDATSSIFLTTAGAKELVAAITEVLEFLEDDYDK